MVEKDTAALLVGSVSEKTYFAGVKDDEPKEELLLFPTLFRRHRIRPAHGVGKAPFFNWIFRPYCNPIY